MFMNGLISGLTTASSIILKTRYQEIEVITFNRFEMTAEIADIHHAASVSSIYSTTTNLLKPIFAWRSSQRYKLC